MGSYGDPYGWGKVPLGCAAGTVGGIVLLVVFGVLAFVFLVAVDPLLALAASLLITGAVMATGSARGRREADQEENEEARRAEPGVAAAVASIPSSPPSPQRAAAPTLTASGPARPAETPGRVIRTGQWEVIESASEYIRVGTEVSVNVDARVVVIIGKVVTSGIDLREAVAEIDGKRLRLSKGSERQFVLVPDDPEDLGRAVDAIREHKAPGERREASVAPAAAATPPRSALPPAADTLPQPPAADDAAQRIEARLGTLKRLRATGAISEEEYGARRNKILDEI